MSRLFVFIAAIVLFGLFCYAPGIYILETGKQSVALQAQARAEQDAVDAGLPVEKYALLQQAEVAKAGFTSNAAIAASGDMSTVAVVKSLAQRDTTIAIAIIAICVTVCVMMITSRMPKKTQQSNQEIQDA